MTEKKERSSTHMIDVTEKQITQRIAIARGQIFMKTDTMTRILSGQIVKGDVLTAAQLAGVMAAKKCSDIIPLCHPLPLTSVKVEIQAEQSNHSFHIQATVKVTGKTGVEMEALTAVSVAALTIYDMCKSIDPEMVIGEIMLLEKQGGRSGHFKKLNRTEQTV